ncbi:MAG: hypothetical protein DK305_001007 [Chloroflexi bacterium]|jgi:uncharacterized OB-fold protein|nr:MAG: hypothetical protein DK305_001007 [Chloroflexota bacterium]|tara:strand:- start:8393 stop:8845 length:453 start_codon:yes stop_codon:yes gene_type:complete
MSNPKKTNKLYSRPIPDPDILTAKEFWEGTKNNKLILPFCNDCQKSFFYPRIICPFTGCHSKDLSWKESTGKGHLYTFAIQHVAIDGWKEKIPFVTAFIDTTENVRMLSVLINVDASKPESIKIGSSVQVKFEKATEQIYVPYWEIVTNE